MAVKEIKTIYSNEASLTDILISLLSDSADYSDYVARTVNMTPDLEEKENEW